MVRILRKLDSDTLHLPELKPLLGRVVEITVEEHIPKSAQQATGAGKANEHAAPNTGMLQALSLIQEIHKGMNPKKDEKDYLREARSGAMYGFGDDD